MFSDHLKTIDNLSGQRLFLFAAALVIVCQLVAMALVANGQVEKALVREAGQASAREATAWCVETNTGAGLRDCDRAGFTGNSQTALLTGSAAPKETALSALSHRD